MIVTISLEPDLKLVERLTFIQEDLGKILAARGADSRWTRPEHMHLPLMMLGHQEPDEYPEITRILSQVTQNLPPFYLTVAGIGAYPSPECPRFIMVGIDDKEGRVQALRNTLVSAFDKASFPYDARPFHPGILLGRTVTNAGRVDLTDAMKAICDLNFGQSEIFEVAVFGTALLDTKPDYQVLARCPLGRCP